MVVTGPEPPLVDRLEVVARDEGDRHLPGVAEIRGRALVAEVRVEEVAGLPEPEHVRLDAFHLTENRF